MAKKRRPSKFTKEIGDAICARLAAGESLRAVCRDTLMPHEATARGWARDREDFATQYAKAREIGYLGLADELLEIADDGSNDTYKDDDGNQRTDHDVIARSRLRVDTRKWMLSKMLPKVYGDKLEHTGKDGGPISLEALVLGSYGPPK